ncbi:CAP domain-containing protein, partial [Dichomitus squalens]
YLDLHNVLRNQVGAPDLQWSDDLAAKAQSYAEQCELKHSDGALGPFGENLAAATGLFDALRAVELFVQDQATFNRAQLKLTHYTQVIWRSTTQLGCGVATCGNIFPGDGDATYHVCLYDPVGNVVGEETLVHSVFVCYEKDHSSSAQTQPSSLLNQPTSRTGLTGVKPLSLGGRTPAILVYLSSLPWVWQGHSLLLCRVGWI